MGRVPRAVGVPGLSTGAGGAVKSCPLNDIYGRKATKGSRAKRIGPRNPVFREPEVTDEMVQAGVNVLRGWGPHLDEKTMARRVFLAMSAAKNR